MFFFFLGGGYSKVFKGFPRVSESSRRVSRMGFGAGLKFHFRRWFGSDGLEGFRFRISFFFPGQRYTG